MYLSFYRLLNRSMVFICHFWHGLTLIQEIRPKYNWIRYVLSAFAPCNKHHQCDLSYLTTGQTAAKVLEGSHQQHGFLSITYTQAVTKNVRHKLTTRQERPTRGGATTAGQRVTSDPLADNSPQYLREILLTTQPFDVVLFCPLLATVAGVFQVEDKCLTDLVSM